MHIRINDINTVFIHKRRIRPLPRRDTSAAGPERDGCLLDPSCPETIEEICLSRHLAVFEIRVAEFADVYLVVSLISSDLEKD